MKALQRTLLAIALALPAAALLAADPPAVDPHADHAPTAAPSEAAADPMAGMRERMQQIRQTTDPEKRKELMDAQMKDMETMMRRPAASCPKADGMAGKCGGKAMMGGMGGMGGMADKCGGKAMKGGMQSGKCGMSDDMLHRRMDMMEKRMDMMQMMMQNRMGQSMPGK